MKALRNAIVAIVNADATMQTLCGRTTALCVNWKSLRTATLPVVAYWIVTDRETGQSGLHRRVMVQLTCLADRASGGLATAEDLAARLRDLLVWPKFDGQGVDAAPEELRVSAERDLEDAALDVSLERVDLDVTFNVKLA